MWRGRVVIVGAGIGGLVCAALLAAHGLDVTVVEKESEPGGKMRRVAIDGAAIDAGPTVFTLRDVFESVFAAAGASLDDHVVMRRADTLARHAWAGDRRLDLFSDVDRSAEAIGDFAGAEEARRFRAFCARARRVYATLDRPFMRSAPAGVLGLVGRVGLAGLPDLARIAPFTSLWRALGDHFHDPRLRQLFGRYATYCGSSPFLAPATLMLVAHVEQEGVWLVEGGMHRLAQALADVTARSGGILRYGVAATEVCVDGGRVAGVDLATGERLEADTVVVNADVSAIAEGLLGDAIAHATARVPLSQRSLSAVTWTLLAETSGFPLLRHNVFFSNDYPGEFDDLTRHRRLPRRPTVYVCAQDRGDRDSGLAGPERLLCLVNAPPTGDDPRFDASEIMQCEELTFAHLRRCGLRVDRRTDRTIATTPADFARMFPATGGALYGRASHGWMASFRRPGARTAIPGLYLAGGSTHPGPGVPMVALSGQQAAISVMTDRASTRQFLPAATPGGMSMRSATTGRTGSR